MDKLIITPEHINNQYSFTLPKDLEEQEIEIRIVIHYKPKKVKKNKHTDINKYAGIFKDSTYESSKSDWYQQ